MKYIVCRGKTREQAERIADHLRTETWGEEYRVIPRSEGWSVYLEHNWEDLSLVNAIRGELGEDILFP